MTNVEADRKLLDELGGPSKVADLVGFPKLGGPQRVQNWYARGIPAAIRVQRPDLFMRGVWPSGAANNQPAAQAAEQGA